MNRLKREARRPATYLAAAGVGVAAALVGLNWWVAVGIAVVSLVGAFGVSLLVDARRATDVGTGSTGSLQRPPHAPPKSRVGDPSEPPTAGPMFRLEGEYWTIAFRGPTFRLHDAKGLHYIRRLLEAPGREIHALDLLLGGEGSGGSGPLDLEEEGMVHADTGQREVLLDAKARESYRLRVEDLRAQIDDAEAHGDRGRAARAQEELDWIARELGRSIGVGGRPRRAPGEVEKARLNVTRTVKASIAKIAERDPTLGHHLDHEIRTGTYCSYAPDPADTPDWRF